MSCWQSVLRREVRVETKVMEDVIEIDGLVFKRCVNHFPDIYVNSNGLLYDSSVGKVLDVKPHNVGDYKTISATNIKKIRRNCVIHRMVAFYYIENDRPDEAIYVNHINLEKLDNRVENLEWVTRKENGLHWAINRRRKKSDIHNDPWSFAKSIEMAHTLPRNKVILKLVDNYLNANNHSK